MDTWINGYTSPIIDLSQDLNNITGNTVDGLTTLSFMRKRSTGDSKAIYFYFYFKINSIIFFNLINVKQDLYANSNMYWTKLFEI